MKKQYYPWWGYVKSIVRKYPERKYRTDLKGVEEKERASVQSAYEKAWDDIDGSTRCKAIGMMHFHRTHTLTGAAQEIGCDRATAARWQRKFFEDVARNMGLLD